MNNQVRIVKQADILGGDTIASSMGESYVASKAKLAIEAISIKYDKVEELITSLKEKYGYKEYKFNSRSFSTQKILENDTSIIFVALLRNENKALIDIYEQGYEPLQELYNFCKSFMDYDGEIIIKISNIYSSGDSKIDYDVVDKSFKDFNENDVNFYPYLDVYGMFEQFLYSDSNILFLCGKPGVGKTRLADLYCRYLIEKVNDDNTDSEVLEKILDQNESSDERQSILVFTAKNEKLLSLDSFWNKIIKNTPALVFLDDLDFISKRIDNNSNTDKNQFISQFLSFTEGIHKNSNKTKFIITTNKEFSEIDEALLRKGRCFDILNIQGLTYDEALEIWENKKLNIKSFDEYFKGHDEVLQCDLGDAIKVETLKSKHGIEFKPYLLKDGISLIKKVNRVKKTGFLK